MLISAISCAIASISSSDGRFAAFFAAVFLAAVVCLAAFTVSEKHQQEQLRQEAAALEQENQDLKDRISILGSVESVKQIANEILGLVDKDTVIFETE